ncbi:DUF1015 domain-containing protein [Clostridium akagii]|uniref:DUF1015 domain-containing protein n=1 Tax=Clostridium akagii TaxID=91623 RepID=UPI00047D49CB|nr:DUF1015 family protein [Clostridium akagii]
MAKIKAFKAIRPKKNLAEEVAALPYDVMNYEEAKEMVKGNPYSFLHIDRAEIDLEDKINPYDKRVYEKAKTNLQEFRNKGILLTDEKQNIYLYRQIMDGRVQTGIVCCTSIDDYLNGVVKKHEYTREDKELDRINHVDYCNANTGPIFLTYKRDNQIDKIVDDETKKIPLYNFVSEDMITHMVWVIEDEAIIKNIVDVFKEIPSLYIADGHHRTAAAIKVGQKRRKQNPNYKEEAEFNYFLSVLYPAEELKIFDYNRVVKDLNGLKIEEFISKVEVYFEVEKLNDVYEYKPSARHIFGMYVEGFWYKLRARQEKINEDDVVASLDVSLLQENLLSPILGIKDIRKDDRIEFVGGIRGIKELTKRVNTDMKIAFSMYPTSIEELMKIADQGKVMPPKSTWFEPKIRSGLFIHSLES